MSRRFGAVLAAFAMALGFAALLPAGPAHAAECAAPWSSSSVYWGGNSASYGGRNWQAKWWTQNERPGSADVWSRPGCLRLRQPRPR